MKRFHRGIIRYPSSNVINIIMIIIVIAVIVV